MSRSTTISLFAHATFLLALGCSTSAASRSDVRRELLEDLGQEQFVSGYRSFENRSETLLEAAEEFCSAPDADGLSTTQDAWWKARTPWKRNELLAFGPYVDEPDRLGPKIDFWPARVESIAGVLAGADPVDAEAVATFGTTTRGFPVIEYLLYQPDVDLVSEFETNERRCDYLLGLCEDLNQLAHAMYRAWAPDGNNYLGELVEAGHDSEAFDSLDMALGEVVNRLVFTVENIRGEKLGTPLGNRSGGTPQPGSVESRFSGRSLTDARDALTGVERVCLGAEANGPSLARYLEESLGREDLAKDLEQRFDESNAALDAIEETLAETVEADPDSVQAAIDVLAELQRLIQVDIINAMGLTLTFNDADGD